jgi:hypothetical protein
MIDSLLIDPLPIDDQMSAKQFIFAVLFLSDHHHLSTFEEYEEPKPLDEADYAQNDEAWTESFLH